MLTSVRAVTSRGSEGEPLPAPFPSLAGAGVVLRRGELSLLVGSPGSGKSAVALILALRMAVPAFYFSADTSAPVMIRRTAAAVSGHTQATVERGMDNGGEDYYTDLLNQRAPFIEWCFDSSPELQDIEEELACYAMVHGEFPHLLVVDNLLNVQADGSDDDGGWQAMKEVVRFLHEVGRRTGAHVMLLHHATGAYDDGNKPIPLSGAAGKVSKLPEQVLTILRQGDVLSLCVAKNRSGPSAGDGSHRVPFQMDLSRMQMQEVSRWAISEANRLGVG